MAWGPNRIDIFVEGVDSQLWHQAWTGSGWYGWQPLGGTLTASPAVSSWSPNRLGVFARSNDNAICHQAWTGSSWYGWQSLGGDSLSSPGGVSSTPGRVDVVTEGAGGQAWHQWWNGSNWSGWAESMGGNLSSGTAVASTGGSELDVMAAGQGQVPERLNYQNGGQLWQPLGQSPGANAPISPQTAYAPALLAPGGTVEEGCVTNSVSNSPSDIYCVQLSSGTPPAQQVPPAGSMSPSAAANA